MDSKNIFLCICCIISKLNFVLKKEDEERVQNCSFLLLVFVSIIFTIWKYFPQQFWQSQYSFTSQNNWEGFLNKLLYLRLATYFHPIMVFLVCLFFYLNYIHGDTEERMEGINILVTVSFCACCPENRVVRNNLVLRWCRSGIVVLLTEKRWEGGDSQVSSPPSLGWDPTSFRGANLRVQRCLKRW